MHRTFAPAALLGVALALAACGDDAGTAPTDAGDAAGDPAGVTCVAGDGGATTVDIVEFNFAPGDASVAAGGTVTFTNRDAAPHSVWSEERSMGGRAWASVGADPEARAPETLDTDVSTTCTFPAAGTYSYLCGIHNTMRGTVTVG